MLLRSRCVRRRLARAASSLGVDVAGFARDGFGVVPGFASEAECDGMRERMSELIDAWDPTELVVFRTDSKQEEEQCDQKKRH